MKSMLTTSIWTNLSPRDFPSERGWIWTRVAIKPNWIEFYTPKFDATVFGDKFVPPTAPKFSNYLLHDMQHIPLLQRTLIIFPHSQVGQASHHITDMN